MIGFGALDLKIRNDCNLNENSCSNLGFSYQLPNELKYETIDA